MASSNENLSIVYQLQNDSTVDNSFALALTLTIGLLATPSLILYFSVWSIILVNYGKFKCTYLLCTYILSVGCSDMTSLIIQLCYCLPQVLCRIKYEKNLDKLFGILVSFVIQSQARHVFAIALNRVVYASMKSYQKFNKGFASKQNTIVLIVGISFVSVAIVIVEQMLTCSWSISFGNFTLEVICIDQILGRYGKYLGSTISSSFATLSVAFYVLTWLLLKKRQNQASIIDDSRRKREQRLLIEFSIITLILLLDNTLNLLTSFNVAWPYEAFLLVAVNILNTTINPIVYLIFDRKLQSCLASIRLTASQKVKSMLQTLA